MNWTKIFFLSFFGLSLVYAPLVLALKKPAFELEKEWEQPLLSLLAEAELLHKAFNAKQAGQVFFSSSKMEQKITQMLGAKPPDMPYHQTQHLYSLLNSLRQELEVLKLVKTKGVRQIKLINRTLTYVAHIYDLKKNYAVFFCPQDRSVFLQAQQGAQGGPHRGARGASSRQGKNIPCGERVLGH